MAARQPGRALLQPPAPGVFNPASQTRSLPESRWRANQALAQPQGPK